MARVSRTHMSRNGNEAQGTLQCASILMQPPGINPKVRKLCWNLGQVCRASQRY
jgi:hypothetical protein